MKTCLELASIGNRLKRVTSLRFEAQSGNGEGGWNGSGTGSVIVEVVNATTILFQEAGTWVPEGGNQLAFTNVFRWTLSLENLSIRLEHLRFGVDNPVFLFDLKQAAEEVWESVEPHVCRDDLYTARMDCDNAILRLHWTIEGPTKNEDIRYWYH